MYEHSNKIWGTKLRNKKDNHCRNVYLLASYFIIVILKYERLSTVTAQHKLAVLLEFLEEKKGCTKAQTNRVSCGCFWIALHCCFLKHRRRTYHYLFLCYFFWDDVFQEKNSPETCTVQLCSVIGRLEVMLLPTRLLWGTYFVNSEDNL